MRWKRIKKWFRWSIPALLAFGIWFALCLPDTLFTKPLSPALFDRDGRLLAAHVASDGQWRFESPDSLPSKFTQALIEFEDRNFNEHCGVYLPSLLSAFQQNLKAGKIVRGGSTLSMQVIRLSRDNPSRSYFEKLTEIFRAIRLELRSDKEEILRMYATHAPMGGNVVGLETAAWRYFGRSPHELSWAESATLAVLPNAPSLIFPGKNQERLKNKRDRLLQHLFEQGYFDEVTLELSQAEEIPPRPLKLPQQAIHLLHTLEQQNPTQARFNSHLEFSFQEEAQSQVNQRQKLLSRNQVHNAAAVICETSSGKVIAYVGNATNSDEGGSVNIVNAPRSPGSTLKPFLYMALLREGLLTPSMLIEDTPIDIQGFTPKNFDKKFNGYVPADEALARSLNVPAVLELQRYGVAPFHANLEKLGFDFLTKSPSHYGLSLILGGGEVSLFQLLSAYRQTGANVNAFFDANGEVISIPSLTVLKDETPLHETPLFDAGTAYSCLNALEKVKRPLSEAGWEMTSNSRRIAWKTGTSYGFRDAWAVGVTKEYTIAVWVGNADGTGRPGVIGTQAAAPLLFDLFDMLPPTSGFQVPYDDLHEIDICAETGHRARDICPHSEKRVVPFGSLKAPPCPHHKRIFVDQSGKQVNKSCEPDAIETSHLVFPPIEAWFYKQNHPEYASLPKWREDCTSSNSERQIAILHPLHNSRFQLARDLDESIDPLVFEAISIRPNTTLFWHLDDEFLGKTRTIHQKEYMPEPGLHTLTIMEESGEKHTIQFTVY